MTTKIDNSIPPPLSVRERSKLSGISRTIEEGHSVPVSIPSEHAYAEMMAVLEPLDLADRVNNLICLLLATWDIVAESRMLRPIERIVDNMAMDIEVPEESDDDGSGPSKDRVIELLARLARLRTIIAARRVEQAQEDDQND